MKSGCALSDPFRHTTLILQEKVDQMYSTLNIQRSHAIIFINSRQLFSSKRSNPPNTTLYSSQPRRHSYSCYTQWNI